MLAFICGWCNTACDGGSGEGGEAGLARAPGWFSGSGVISDNHPLSVEERRYAKAGFTCPWSKRENFVPSDRRVSSERLIHHHAIDTDCPSRCRRLWRQCHGWPCIQGSTSSMGTGHIGRNKKNNRSRILAHNEQSNEERFPTTNAIDLPICQMNFVRTLARENPNKNNQTTERY
jgi:hypothetical protein